MVLKIADREIADEARTPAADVLLRAGTYVGTGWAHSKNERATIGLPRVGQLRQANARICFLMV